MLVCAICFGLFSVAVSKSKTYRENRAILRALGVKPASSRSVVASCEDVVERETRGMTFYATDLFGWSPFVETRFGCRPHRRRDLKYSLSRSSSSAAESAEPSEEENEDVPVAVASPKEIENEVGGTDTSEDERGERQQQQLVVTKEDGNEKEKATKETTATTTSETETTDDDNEQESSVGSKDVREYENEEETEKKAAEKLANAKELLFVPPDKTPYRYAFIDWLKPALQDDPKNRESYQRCRYGHVYGFICGCESVHGEVFTRKRRRGRRVASAMVVGAKRQLESVGAKLVLENVQGKRSSEQSGCIFELFVSV